MGKLLAEYQLEHGLTDEQLAERLTERLGTSIRQPITAGGIRTRKLWKDENIPKAWVSVLDLKLPEPEYDLPDWPEEDTGQEPPPDLGGPAAGRPSAAGAEPAGSGSASPRAKGGKEPRQQTLEVFPVFDRKDAREALVAIHKQVGRFVARIRDDQEFVVIFDRAAPILAEDWLDLAQVNPKVAKFLQTLTFGGSAEGKLAFHYFALLYAVLTRRKPDGQADFPPPSGFAPGFDSNGAGGAAGADAGGEGAVGAARAAPAG